jgi:hypothetical protein
VGNPNKFGLVVGVLLAVGTCSGLVSFCLAERNRSSTSFFCAHDQAGFFVKPFDAVAAVTLIVITTIIGYLFGFSAR